METTKKQKGEEKSNAEPCDATTTLGVDGRWRCIHKGSQIATRLNPKVDLEIIPALPLRLNPCIAFGETKTVQGEGQPWQRYTFFTSLVLEGCGKMPSGGRTHWDLATVGVWKQGGINAPWVLGIPDIMFGWERVMNVRYWEWEGVCEPLEKGK
jgi:hypothetical protein